MKHFLSNKNNFLLTCILLIAAFMRLYRIQDYMTFLGDEGRDVIVAYNILHGHFTLLGPTASVGGFYFGPIYYYFMAPALFLAGYNPVGPAIMVALFGVATVWLVYILGKEFFNSAVGIIAALFYAISPLVIAYSRSSWNPNPVPFFAVLVVWFTYTGIKKSNQPKQQTFWHSAKKDFLLAGLFLGIAVELHFIAAILGITVGLYLLLIRMYLIKTTSLLKQYLWLLLGFFIGWLPYLGFEFRHGFPNTRSVLAFVFHSNKISGDNGNFVMIVGNVFFRLFARLIAAFPPQEQLYHYPNPTLLNVWIIFVLAIMIGSVGLFAWQVIKENKKPYAIRHTLYAHILVLFWLICGIAFFGIYKRQIYDYYFGFMFPLPFLLVANLLVFSWGKKIAGKIIASILFIIVLGLNLQGIPFRYTPNRQLQQMETIAKFVNEKTDGKPFNFALLTGGNSDHAYRYFFTLWGHEPVTIQNAAIDPQRKTVTNQLFVVCESLPCKPLGNPLFEIAGFGRGDIVDKWDVSVVEVYKLVHYKGK